MRVWLPVVTFVVGCGGPEGPECDGWDEVFVYTDGDGDGYGIDPVGWTCAPADGQTVTSGDCDDQDGTTYPNADELCDLVDNDCNGSVDDGIAMLTWYDDDDGDSFGGHPNLPTCAQPPGTVAQAGDCDDDDAEVNPLVREVCNGYDDDCDGDADDDDGGVDPTTQVQWYRDADDDGYGDDTAMVEACEAPSAVFIRENGDCDDARPVVNPDGNEICNLRDDDCDGFVDDEDPSIDPAGQTQFFSDGDLDGYGDPTSLTLACRPIPGAVTNDDDCDDTEPTATVVRDWFHDGDFDGVGAGPVVATDCYSPGFGNAPSGTDCNDADPLQFPGNPEICEDGFDQDCSGSDRQCATWLYTVREQGDVLRRFDVQTGSFEEIGPLGTTFDFGDLAYDPTSHTMYMIDGRGVEGLHTVDLLTGNATLVGQHNVADLFGLTWDPTTGTLYGAQFSQPGFFQLDTATGAANFVGNPGVGFGGLAFDTLRGQLLGINDGGGDIYTVNPANANSVFLTNGGGTNDSGMTYEPVGDKIYDIDWNGTLYRYDPQNNYNRTILLNNLGSHDGLVYVPDPPN